MPAQLVALNDGPNIVIDKPILLLGRHPECDVQIDSRKISRKHCCIALVSDYLVVRDLDSTNGVRINGIRVVEGKLNPGDELTIGAHRYRVAWDASSERPLPPPARPKAAAAVPVPKLTTAHSVRPEEDDMLESCDEPIALPDPGRGGRGAEAGGGGAGRAVKPQPRPHPAAAAPPPPPAGKDEDSVVIPENLLPRNGSYPPGVSGPNAAGGPPPQPR